MPTESLEVLIARMSEQMKHMQEDMNRDRDSRKHQYEKIEAVNQIVTKMDGRLASVESSLASAKPTIEEFITIKHKVVGAGMAGKWLWAVAGFGLGAAVWLREHIANIIK